MSTTSNWSIALDTAGFGTVKFLQGWNSTRESAGQITGWIGNENLTNVLNIVSDNPVFGWLTIIGIALPLVLLGGKGLLAVL